MHAICPASLILLLFGYPNNIRSSAVFPILPPLPHAWVKIPTSALCCQTPSMLHALTTLPGGMVRTALDDQNKAVKLNSFYCFLVVVYIRNNDTRTTCLCGDHVAISEQFNGT